MWYCQNVVAHHVTLLDTERSGIWYTHNIQMHQCSIQAPKIFRRASKILLGDVHFAHAQETLWNCREITLNQVTVNGDYFAMNSRDIQATDLTIMPLMVQVILKLMGQKSYLKTRFEIARTLS